MSADQPTATDTGVTISTPSIPDSTDPDGIVNEHSDLRSCGNHTSSNLGSLGEQGKNSTSIDDHENGNIVEQGSDCSSKSDSCNSHVDQEGADHGVMMSETDTFFAATGNMDNQEAIKAGTPKPTTTTETSTINNVSSISSGVIGYTPEPTNVHGTNEALETTEAMKSIEQPSQEDEVQIIDINTITHPTWKNYNASTTDYENMIDLTMEEDESDASVAGSSSSSMPLPLAQKAPHIKPEPTNEVRSRTDIDYARRRGPSTDHFHNLPELGPAAFPDITGSSAQGGYVNPGSELTSDQIADLLLQFNKNNAEVQSPAGEPDTDDEDTQAKVKFEKLKEDFEERQRINAVTTVDRIEFNRAADAELSRVRLQQNRKQHEYDQAAREMQDSLLFIPEQEDPLLSKTCGPEVSYTNAYENQSPELTDTSKRGVQTKKPGRGRPKGKSTKPGENKPIGKSRVSKKQQGTASGTKRKRKPQTAIIDTNGLLHHDLIAEANANEGQEDQPGFTSRVKKDALTQLISSIPLEERNLYAGDKADLTKATLNFNGRGAIKSDGNGNWKLRGMKSSLRNYQLLGVSWMRNRENQARHPRGGILSDDMGLGKTVSALANMVDGMPDSNHRGPRATLIVVPPGLMNQWLAEIGTHVEAFRKVIIYRSKIKFLDPVAQLSGQDVVITSYHEVAASIPKNVPPPEIYTAQAKAEWWAKELTENKGPLHQIYWHRIVLDEAQAIKNHLSKTSEAICHLRGRYRWCLSGTPVQNSLEEFYPFFRFLKCENTGSFDLFKRNFVKKGSEKALQRLQVFLGTIMLRRTHRDKLFGRPILILPPIKPVENIEVKFNTVERAIYNIVKNRFVMSVKSLTKADDPNKSYQMIFTLLLRLRQLVGHPLLIQKTLKDLLETEDLERLWSLTKANNTAPVDGDDTVTDGNYETTKALQTALTLSGKSDTTSDYPGSGRLPVVDNDLSAKFRKYLQGLRQDGNWARANERSLCSACGSPPTMPYISSCLHLYCLSCLNDLHYGEFIKNKEFADCLQCGARMQRSAAFVATAVNEPGRRSDINGRQTPDEDIDWYTIGGPILRSAKIKGAVAQIRKWFEQDETNKILVFTQFRGMIKIMARVCREEQWGHALYHGAMSFDERDKQIKNYTDKRECRILLAAMKAGGVGLNLTAANRVIILDLWWNMSVETQAFTRCFRIGQERDVEVARFVVHDSIDTDIQKMQKRKIKEIEQAMEDQHRPQLSTAELLALFGDGPESHNNDEDTQQTNAMDGEDEPFIFPDDPYDKEDDDDDVVMLDAN